MKCNTICTLSANPRDLEALDLYSLVTKNEYHSHVQYTSLYDKEDPLICSICREKCKQDFPNPNSTFMYLNFHSNTTAYNKMHMY